MQKGKLFLGEDSCLVCLHASKQYLSWYYSPSSIKMAFIYSRNFFWTLSLNKLQSCIFCLPEYLHFTSPNRKIYLSNVLHFLEGWIVCEFFDVFILNTKLGKYFCAFVSYVFQTGMFSCFRARCKNAPILCRRTERSFSSIVDVHVLAAGVFFVLFPLIFRSM